MFVNDPAVPGFATLRKSTKDVNYVACFGTGRFSSWTISTGVTISLVPRIRSQDIVVIDLDRSKPRLRGL